MNPTRSALALVLSLAFAASAASDDGPFPRPAALEPDIEFWLRIYTEVDTHGGLIHDSRHLDIVYEVIDLPDDTSARTLDKHSERARKSVTRALRTLAGGKRKNLSGTEKRVLAQWPRSVSSSALRQAAGRVRFQLGQADKFRAGLIRSGRWEPHIRKTLSDMGLPSGLSALPHVESSYNPGAYSRVGAAGLWQFTRSTGRRFMRVDHVVDERLDPYKASIAAGQLLAQNRKVTGTWPLAITAYNHGASGMRRAARKLGTKDIATIVRNYSSRTFGFASRNFYVEFLAALEVDLHSEKYFGPLMFDTPVEYETTSMPFYASANSLTRHLGLSASALQRSNPGLLPTVWQGSKYIPKGFNLRVRRGELPRPLKTAMADLPRADRLAHQTRDRSYTVRRGDTISLIASRYRISERQLAEINGLRNRHRIRIGQKLRLPSDGSTRVAAIRRAPIAPPADGLHMVGRGDTLSRIASLYGMSLNEVVALNDLNNNNRIDVGQPIRLVAAAPLPQSRPVAVKPLPAEPAAVRRPANRISAAAADLTARASSVLPAVSYEPNASPAAASTDLFPLEGDGVGSLLADPSDYSVSDINTIEVQVEETLGHYADWLDIRTSRLRSINGMRYGQTLVVGNRLKLEFAKTSREQFEMRRIEHHRALQGEFFDRFEIAGTTIHIARRGESLWVLSNKRYRVPLWLLRQHNPDLSLTELRAGTRITIPTLRAHDPADAKVSTTSELRRS